MKHSHFSHLLRRLTALTLAAVLAAPAVWASAGKQQLQTTRPIVDGLDFVNTVTTHSTAGRVESYLLDYNPDGDLTPILIQGSGTMYSGATINKAVAQAQSMGYQVMAAVNTDFFSQTTGVPMGIVVEDGVYKSSPEGRNALLIDEDGEFSLLEAPEITMTLTNRENDEEISLTHLNKWRTPSGGLYLLNEYFSEVSTRTTTDGWMVRFREVDEEDELTVSGKLKLEVVEVMEGSVAVPIGEDNYILTADAKANLSHIPKLFQPGDRVTLTTQCDEDSEQDLEDALWACGAGDLMVENGKLTDSSNWAYINNGRDPRTALGVRKDGSVVLYVADGRKSGYSGGLTQLDLAKEMIDQDCRWAVNLDGGGSSAMSVWVPGLTGPGVVNLPSDGAPRNCATYLLLVTEKEGSGRPDRLALKNDGLVVYTGTSLELGQAAVLDNGLNPLDEELEDLTIRSDGLGEVEGTVYTAGDRAGTDELTLRSKDLNIRGTAQVHVVDTLTELTVSKQGSSSALTSLKLQPGQQVQLDATGRCHGRVALRDPSGLSWTVEGDVGAVDETGLFTASTVGGKEGSITARAGGLSVTIPVKLTSLHLDVTESHWAYTAVDYCYEKELVSGVSPDRFGPDQNIRRGDFLLMLYRAAGTPKVNTTVDFPDVSPDDYYADAIAWAQENGLASGMGDGSFAPKINVTREQAFTILCRVLPHLDIHCEDMPVEVLNRFSDVGEISSWAKQFSATLVSYQIVGGSGGRLNPQGNLTRAEMAALLYKLGSYDPDKVTPLLPEEPEAPVEPELPEIPEVPETPDTPDIPVSTIVPVLAYNGMVNGDVEKLNVRVGPGTDQQATGSVTANTRLVVLDRADNGWLRVQYLEGTTLTEGYVSGEYVTFDPNLTLPLPGLTEQAALPQLAYNGQVKGDVTTLNVRAGAGTDFEVLDTLTANHPVVVTETLDSWVKIQYLDSETSALSGGFVSRDYVDLND